MTPLRLINSVGLDPHVGFLHEMNPSKNSLAYDLQEPFRFLVDFAVLNLIETNGIDKKDFIRTENYSLRPRPSGG
jgi:CRISPR-associated protein Cas1